MSETAAFSMSQLAELETPHPYAVLKRLMDVVISSIALIGLAPLLCVCALVVRLDSSGPVLFRQERLGRRGRPFTMLKFRSMTSDADPAVHRAYMASFIEGNGQSEPGPGGDLYKLVRDPRITRVGHWLRRTSLDELPQLWNVLRGEMSLVGPRPPIRYEVERYQPRQLRRLAVKPGITGLWQVSGRNRTTFERMIELDLEYIRNRSLGMDLRILVLTIPVVLFARDAK